MLIRVLDAPLLGRPGGGSPMPSPSPGNGQTSPKGRPGRPKAKRTHDQMGAHGQITPQITPHQNRRKRCGKCYACVRELCGQCNPCRNMPRFGGPGTLRQGCHEKRCIQLLLPPSAEQADAPAELQGREEAGEASGPSDDASHSAAALAALKTSWTPPPRPAPPPVRAAGLDILLM